MTRRWKWAAIGLGIACIAVFAILQLSKSPQRAEPVYRGKTLTQWLKKLDDGEAFGISSRSLPHPSRAQIEAAAAIRAIGTNALPLLMQDIHSKPSRNSTRFRLQDRLDSLIGRVSGRRDLVWDLVGDITEEDRIRWRAAQGLAALGPLARQAIPELNRLLFTNYWHSSIKEAAYALATIGPEGVKILTNAVGRDEWAGMCAIWALGQHPEVGTNVIPFLIGATTSASEGTACGAIQVLGLFHVDSENVLPALTNLVAGPTISPARRRDAARALGQFGPNAASTAPLLENLTNDASIASEVKEALKSIKAPQP